MENIKMQLAENKDMPIIALLAQEIWQEWYTSIIGKEQVNYMLAHFYNYEALLEQKNQQDFYIVYQNLIPIGYIAVSDKKNGNFFIDKFYLKPQQHSKGIGTFIMKKIIDTYKPKTLSLQVNRKNFIPINFYFKQGFKIIAVEDFYIGQDFYMNDFVMHKDF